MICDGGSKDYFCWGVWSMMCELLLVVMVIYFAMCDELCGVCDVWWVVTVIYFEMCFMWCVIGCISYLFLNVWYVVM